MIVFIYNMKLDALELQQKMIDILKANSRKSINDIALELGISRITAKKMMDILVSTGRIKRFTITLEDDERDVALVRVDDLTDIPMELVLEYLRMLDGSYLVLVYFEDLLRLKGSPVRDIQIAVERRITDRMQRKGILHCDYCRKEIAGDPIVVDIRGRKYYACCPNCAKDLKRRERAVKEVEI